MKNIAIFASGGGTNAEAIFNYFEQNPSRGRVVALISNNAEAFALQRARNHQVPAFSFSRETIYNNTQKILDALQEKQADFIVLAGFMLLVPMTIIQKFDGRIVNIHPALLPKFAGKGMYGDNVHRAVIEAGEKESGITIHFVNEKYDQGAIIFQTKVGVGPMDTAETLAQKIHKLEWAHFPKVIAQL